MCFWSEILFGENPQIAALAAYNLKASVRWVSAECMTLVNVDFRTRDAKALFHPLTILATPTNREIYGTGSWNGLERKQNMQKPIDSKQAFLFWSSAILEPNFSGCFAQFEQLTLLAALCCILGSFHFIKAREMNSCATLLKNCSCGASSSESQISSSGGMSSRPSIISMASAAPHLKAKFPTVLVWHSLNLLLWMLCAKPF